jgi:hypothetical protein
MLGAPQSPIKKLIVGHRGRFFVTKAHSSVDKIAGAVHKKAIAICATALSSRERSRPLATLTRIERWCAVHRFSKMPGQVLEL